MFGGLIDGLSDLGSDIWGGIKGLGGESPADRQERLLNNQFANVNKQDFMVPGMQGGVNQRGQMAQAGNQNRHPFMSQLQNQFQGQGPGQEIARRQAQMQTQAGVQNQLSQAAGQRGNPLAARTAATNSANLGAQGQQAAAMGGLQAQVQAGNLLGQQLGQQDQRQAELMRQQMLMQQMQGQQMNNAQQARTSRYGSLAGVNTNQPNAQQQGLGFVQGAYGMFS